MSKIFKKRICIRLLMIVFVIFQLSLIVEARVVGYSEALLAATRLLDFESNRPHFRLTREKLNLAQIEALIYQQQQVAYLVRFYPQGFMILADITEICPQIFISYSGDFDKVQEHPFILEILNRLQYDKIHLMYLDNKLSSAEIAESKESADLIQISKNERTWSDLLNGSFSVSQNNVRTLSADGAPPLIETKWDQTAPYWNNTPMIGGNHTYTGCTATAIAQLMYYWNCPNLGQGSHAYNWRGQTLSANFLNWLRWDLMRPSYAGGYTAEEAFHVARVMSYAGIAVDMDYGTDSSNAQLYNNNALVSFFGYSRDIRHVTRYSVGSWPAWFNVFKQQIDINFPVLLAIYKSDGSGHAVVVDGYRSNPYNQIHVNMGWSGMADNYYTVDNIYGYGYANWDYAEINIHPTKVGLWVQSSAGGTTNPVPELYNYPFADGINIRITATPEKHYRMLNWSGRASGSQNPIDIVLDRGKTVKANFQRIIYAPINATGKKNFNRSLSQAEYINILTFEPNPDNENITGYKIYLVNSAGKRAIATLSADTHQYWHRGLKKETVYTYEIVAINNEPRDGDPATVVVR